MHEGRLQRDGALYLFTLRLVPLVPFFVINLAMGVPTDDLPDEAAVVAWRNLEAHRRAQAKGRDGIFRNYRLRVASVIRDYGLHDGEWKMTGGADTADSIMIASEPLTRDISTWLEVPEYSMIYADTRSGRPTVEIHYLD